MGTAASSLAKLGKSAKKAGKQPDKQKSRSFKRPKRASLPPGAGVFKVYHVVYYPETINTNFLFVEHDDNGGEMHHITGSDSRRQYEVMLSDMPNRVSPNFSTMTWIGTVQGDKHAQFRQLCRSVPPPRKEGSVWMYSYRGEPMKTTEQWTLGAIDALIDGEVLNP